MDTIAQLEAGERRLGFQRLQVYQVGREALGLLVRSRSAFRGLPGELGPQLERALTSALLNIAEGSGRWSAADQRRHYQIACGSATEAAACIDLAAVHRVPASITEPIAYRLGRVVAMLLAMLRRR